MVSYDDLPEHDFASKDDLLRHLVDLRAALIAQQVAQSPSTEDGRVVPEHLLAQRDGLPEHLASAKAARIAERTAQQVSPEGSVVYAEHLAGAFSVRMEEAIRNGKVLPQEELKAWETVAGAVDQDALANAGTSLDGLTEVISSESARSADHFSGNPPVEG